LTATKWRYKMRLMNHLRKTSDGTREVRLVVPADCRSALGKNNLTKRLGRISASEASRLAVPVVAEFQARIAEAKLTEPPLTPKELKKREQKERAGALWREQSVLWKAMKERSAEKQSVQLQKAVQAALSGQVAKPVAAVSLMGLFDGYAKERQLAPATQKRWRPCVDHLIAHLGHDNAVKISPDDIVAWKEALLIQLSPRTVREVYLAAVKAVYGWGIENRKVETNPAAKISVRVPKARKLRGKGFTPEEATTILREALNGDHSRVSAHYQRARRWVPWVCAYTGARVGEISQMRGADVVDVGGVPTLRITPEAGATKSNTARLVPLHPHLIEMGFIDFVRGVGDGALFYEPARSRRINAANPQHKKAGEHIAKWIRKIGVSDPEVQPNHGWRHLWKTLARGSGIDPDLRDAIQGHATRTEGEAYGEWDIETLDQAMRKIPKFEVR
jgi:integrase